MNVNIICLLTFLFVQTFAAFGQQSPAPFGQLRAEDTSTVEVYFDSEADAVILFDWGYLRFLKGFELELTIHRRIKLFKASSFEKWTQNEMVFPTGRGFGFELKNLEAQTINISSGDMEISAVEESDFMKGVPIDGYQSISYTFPDVKEGSIVEYQYTVKFKNFLTLRDWVFQNDIPTLRSEFIADIPKALVYQYNYRGDDNFEVRTNRELDESEEEALLGPAYGLIETTRMHWVKVDVPAIVPEPYISTVDNYRAKVEFQLAATRFEGLNRDIATSWEKIVEQLYADSEWGGKIKHFETLGDRVLKPLFLNRLDDRHKIEAIYRWVSSSFSVNDDGYQVFTSTPPRKLMRQKSGNTADINLMLIGLLRSKGFSASPVLISTKENGFIISMFPFLRQFNHLIAMVSIDGQNVFLDAADADGYYDMLPVEDLNEVGLIAHSPEKIEWHSMKPKYHADRKIIVQGLLNEAGDFNGKLTIRDNGYAAVATRSRVKSSSPEQFLLSLIEKEEGLVQVDEIVTKGLEEPWDPMEVSCSISISNAAFEIDGQLFIEPLIIRKEKKNPFDTEKRTMPVDFGIKSSFFYSLNLDVGNELEVSELPENHIGRYNSDSKSNYKRFTENKPFGGVQFMYSVLIDETFVRVEDYPNFRAFYSEMVRDQSDVLGITKIKTP